MNPGDKLGPYEILEPLGRFLRPLPGPHVRLRGASLPDRLRHARPRRLDDLRVPPGNRLEALKGRRKEQHSIRVNDQWRLCFRWNRGDAFDVEIVDYH